MADLPDAEEWAAGGYIPSPHQLRAAQAVYEILETRSIPTARLRRSYVHLPSDGVFNQRDFLLGETLLKVAGLAEERRDSIRLTPDRGRAGPAALHEILWGCLVRRLPPWLGAATANDCVSWRQIPDEAREGLAMVLADREDREAFLLALARKFDSKQLAVIGAAGESAVVDTWKRQLENLGRPELAQRVELLSGISDQLGYDLRAPAKDGSVRRVEVKTTARSGQRFRMVLSRNEARVGLSDTGWRLVACRKAGPDVEIVGWCHAAALEPHLPADAEEGSKWMAVEIELPINRLQPGLPVE